MNRIRPTKPLKTPSIIEPINNNVRNNIPKENGVTITRKRPKSANSMPRNQFYYPQTLHKNFLESMSTAADTVEVAYAGWAVYMLLTLPQGYA